MNWYHLVDVVSQNNLTSKTIGVMRKLNKKKIQWIIREIEKGRKITEIAEIQGISRVRVWQLYRQYVEDGETPKLKNPGRKSGKFREKKGNSL